MQHIRSELAARPVGGDLLSFLPAIPDTPERPVRIRAAIASTLMASLELARDGEVALDQLALSGPIGLHSPPASG